MFRTYTFIYMYEKIVWFQAFCTLLRRDMSLNFKSKGNLIVSVLVCNVLMQAYVEESNWPEDFVKVSLSLNVHSVSSIVEAFRVSLSIFEHIWFNIFQKFI